MNEEELLFARRILQRQWLPRDVVNGILQERRSKSGRDRELPLWDVFVDRKLLTPAQVRDIRRAPGSGDALPTVPDVEIHAALESDVFGTRYRGRWIPDNRPVAVRIVPPPLATNDAYRRRYLQEGAVLCALPAHRSLPRTLRCGTTGDALYRVHEWIDGEVQSEVLVRMETLPEEACLALATQVVDALAFLLAKGIHHRDLKPADLLCTHDSVVKLLEPALAPATVEEAAAGGRAIQVSPIYRSPDRLRAETGASFADDVHALGASLYHLAVGELPFPGETPEDIADRILSDAPPDARATAPELSAGFANLLQRMMARDPHHRFADPRTLAAFLDRVRRGRLTEPVPDRPARDPQPPAVAPRRRALSLPLLGICAALFGSTVLTLYLSHRSPSAGIEPANTTVDAGRDAQVPKQVSEEDHLADLERALEGRPWRALYDGRGGEDWQFPAGIWSTDRKRGALVATGPTLSATCGGWPATPTRQVEAILSPVGGSVSLSVPTARGALAWTLTRSREKAWGSRAGWNGAPGVEPAAAKDLGALRPGRFTLRITIFEDRRAVGTLNVGDLEACRWELPFPVAPAAPTADRLVLSGTDAMQIDAVRVRDRP